MSETSETFTVTLPLSEAQADVAGIPRSWLERAIRAVGVPQASPVVHTFGTFWLHPGYCECEQPTVICDGGGCRCQTCGKPERVTLQNESLAYQKQKAS